MADERDEAAERDAARVRDALKVMDAGTRDPSGEQPSQDPQLRRVHERAQQTDEDEPGRGSDLGEGQGGARHNQQ